ncbi:MAG: glycosyltransferase family 9 protein [Methylococcaceae bacterium]|nr:glycosyltransferase family 9 protein [Methylococcaceae bacterium]
MNTPASILIIRLSAIGDVILASALIPLLRSAFPKARLVWLTDETNAELLRHNPRLDQVLVWPRRRWRDYLRAGHYWRCCQEVAELVGELRRQRFAWAIDIQGLLKSGIWARLSGAPVRIGLGSREGSQWLMTRVISRRVSSPLIGKEYRKLAGELGLAFETYAMDIAIPPRTADVAASRLRSAGIEAPPIVLAPFTTRPQKHWFDERWAELARALLKRGPVLLLGGPGERERANAIAAAAPGLSNLSGATSLLEAAAIIRTSRLLVGVDTGLTHLGIAMGAPTLALFGSTRPYLDTGTPRARILYHPLPCSPCRRKPVCGTDYTCMKLHDVDGVLAAAGQLLETTP